MAQDLLRVAMGQWDEAEHEPGDQIGPYRLVRELGSGTFGRVWEAEQITPLRRTVALKIIKAGMDTEAVVLRFTQERQTLARMDHPGIANVLDAGSTPEGRPYFVMECVRGQPLLEYCDSRKLSIEERLSLFLAICAAVQHAHQKGVLHRDLKPSNILVTEVDDIAQPKIIDFGIAKAILSSAAED
ncbi:MAG: serine/threonine protein kinase [Verrucomicrobiales bacterium]|nr:serine/threonine protein kinase [Verrucomicrobiales bacterium]